MSPEQARHHSHRRHHSSQRRRHPYSLGRRIARPSPFEFFRIAVYAFALLWSMAALAISVHFEGVFQASDLTRFVPYALFTSVASMLATLGLGVLVLLFKSGPFAVKVESATCALIGVFWLILSVLTSTSPAEDAEVECFFDADDTELNSSSSFNTEVFHAQYRVLVAAGCVNALLLLSLAVAMVYLTLRYYRNTKMWVEYTGQPLLGKDENGREKSRSTSRSTAPLTPIPPRAAKRATTTTKEKLKGTTLPAITTRSRPEPQPSKPMPAAKPKPQTTTTSKPQTKPAVKSSQGNTSARPKPELSTSKAAVKTSAPPRTKETGSAPPKAKATVPPTRSKEPVKPSSTQRPKRQDTTAPIYSKFQR